MMQKGEALSQQAAVAATPKHNNGAIFVYLGCTFKNPPATKTVGDIISATRKLIGNSA